jgi:hypothetical protein
MSAARSADTLPALRKTASASIWIFSGVARVAAFWRVPFILFVSTLS